MNNTSIEDNLASYVGILSGVLEGNNTSKNKQIIEFIPTPSVNFNAATGGGLPKGKMCIISGSEDSGKIIAPLI